MFRRARPIRGLAAFMMIAAGASGFGASASAQVVAPPVPPDALPVIPELPVPSTPSVPEQPEVLSNASDPGGKRQSEDDGLCDRLGPLRFGCKVTENVIGAIQDPTSVPTDIAGAVFDKAAGLSVGAITDWVADGAELADGPARPA